MELWDAYDKNFNKIDDITLIRGEQIPHGIFHLVCEIIVKHEDGTYLLMQRDPNKNLGMMWELTAGGSALQGETPIACAIRELLEETGIKANHLEEIGRVVQEKHHSLYVEYLCITNSDKNSITLQDGETVAYKWLSATAIMKMDSSELATTRIQKFVDEFKR